MRRLVLGSLFAFEDNSQVTDDDPTMLESESNSASSRCEVGLAGDVRWENMVEPGGIEPPTSCVQGRRSPS